jgi:2-polyprenyl-3-methyl-5-hydroxy-6-metoxy-1,4-benzoquinol methylase
MTINNKSILPAFREHGYDNKFIPLRAEDFATPPQHVMQYVNFLKDWVAPSIADLTILDFGCGRGELVGWLRKHKARAFGVDIDNRFTKSGIILDSIYKDDLPILSTLKNNKDSIFPDDFFDIVISDQVLEHVANLADVTGEIHRVLRSGGVT